MRRPEGFVAKSSKRSAGSTAKKPVSQRATAVSATAKRRKRADRAQYKALTAATRQRRLVWGVSLGSIGALIIAVTVLTLSPALALRTVVVEGSNRLESSQVQQALGGLYGEPLARVSPERIAEALEPLRLIQAFTTRIVPPNTLVVSIVERTPLAAVSVAAGFAVVDAAGVTLWSQPDQPAELPVIAGSAQRNPASFQAVARVLTALPPELVAGMESISATTLDDVRFSMRGSDHQVMWGSADRAREKAKVLHASLIAAGVGEPKLIDVTTPESVVIRDQE
jgi:cell division protein FtsQ